jgi:hypothetical protein
MDRLTSIAAFVMRCGKAAAKQESLRHDSRKAADVCSPIVRF